MRNYLLVFMLFTTILFASKQELTVTILPQKYFVEKIVKDKFDINVMVKPGSSPHNFEPKASQITSLGNSNAYFMMGETSERAWIKRFKQNAKSTIFVDITIGGEKIAMVELPGFTITWISNLSFTIFSTKYFCGKIFTVNCGLFAYKNEAKTKNKTKNFFIFFLSLFYAT